MKYHPVLTSAIVIGLLAFTALPGTADINIPYTGGTGPCTQGECGPCTDIQSSVSTGSSCHHLASLSWTLNVGLVKYKKTNDFLESFRKSTTEGTRRGGLPRTFDEIVTANYDTGPLNRSQKQLWFMAEKITDELEDPAILSYNPDAGGEVIELNGFINQVLTDDALTHIDKTDHGFTIRVWHRSTFELGTKDGLLYQIPSPTPIYTHTFENPNAENPIAGQNALTITKVENIGTGTTTTITRYVQTQTPDKLTVKTYGLKQGVEKLLRQEDLTYSERGTKTWDYHLDRTVSEATVNESGDIGDLVSIRHDQEVYKDFSTTSSGGEPGARRLMSVITAVGTSEEASTNYSYIDSASEPLVHGRLESISRPDGSWEFHAYSDSLSTPTAIETVFYPWKNSTIGERNSNSRKVETLIAVGSVTRTTTVTTTAGGSTATQQIDKEIWTTSTADSSSLFTVEKWDTSNLLSTTTTSRHADGLSDLLAGRTQWIEHPDGTFTTLAYATVGADTKITTCTGAGSHTSITAGTKTTRLHTFGNIVKQEAHEDIATSKPLSSWIGSVASNLVDNIGRPQEIYYNGNPNDKSITKYGCCGISEEQDRTGAITTYDRDLLKRVWRQIYKASSSATAIITTTAYSGLSATTKTNGIFVSASTRSLGGLSTSTTGPDADGDATTLQTTTSSTTVANPRTRTVTYPDNTTTVTVTFADGRIASSTDQENHSTTYDYGTHAESGGGLWTQTISPITSQWTKSYTDSLGRTFKTQYPDGAIASSSYYGASADNGSKGKLATVTDPDENAVPGTGTSISYFYNDEGERFKTIEALTDGQSRTTLTETDVIATVAIHGVTIAPAIVSTTTVNDILVSTSYRSTDGRISATDSLGLQSVTVQSTPANGAWTVTSTNPDGTFSVQTYTDGQLEKSATYPVGATNLETQYLTFQSYLYDDFGRPLSTTDSRTGTTTIDDRRENGAVISVTTNGGNDTTTYVHDVMGRVITTILPDSSETYTSYTDRGQVKTTWGSQTYPTLKVYDQLGRLSKLYTYQSLAPATEPTGVGDSLTTWNYDPQRGWLEEKLDATSKGSFYTYTAAGRLQTRTSARGIVTAYSYDHGYLTLVEYFTNNTAWSAYLDKRIAWLDLQDADPQDPVAIAAAKAEMNNARAAGLHADTHAVHYELDSLGRAKTITQEKQSQLAYGYDDTSTTTPPHIATLARDTETIHYDLNQDGTYGNTGDFTRLIDRSPRSLSRDTGYELKTENLTLETATSYAYSPTTGQFQSVSNGTDTFTYGYTYSQADATDPRVGATSGSGLKTDFMPYTLTKSGTPTLETIRTYEATRDVLSSIENKVDTTVVSKYDYSTVNGGVNSLGQRMGVETTFNLGTDASDEQIADKHGETSWDYDSIGQLTTADIPGDDIDRAYDYDTIGNRLTSAKGTYTTENGASTFAAGTNALTQYYGAVANNIPSDPGANELNQYVAIKTGASTVQPVHDFDGNMTHGPLPVSTGANCTLVWDAENRLIEVKNPSDVTLVKYTYDALSRRMARVTTVGSNMQLTELCIYDGWNCIAQYYSTENNPFTKGRTYLWGLDLSGSLQGAGGVGGLLALTQNATTYYPTYDGNGNVSEYLTSTGTVAAHFEYDPFGNTVVASGDDAGGLDYRFSTKPLDFETGLYYYGYRWYDPLTGRWPSRDPIEEEGGVNLYEFVGNDGVGRVDILGFEPDPIVTVWEPFRTPSPPPPPPTRRELIERDLVSRRKSPCCDESTIENGLLELQEKYQRRKETIIEIANNQGLPLIGEPYKEPGDLSCDGRLIDVVVALNGPRYGPKSMEPGGAQAIAGTVGIPPCWECIAIHGRKSRWTLNDHWWVECTARDKDGKKVRMEIFDLWGEFHSRDIKSNRENYKYTFPLTSHEYLNRIYMNHRLCSGKHISLHIR